MHKLATELYEKLKDMDFSDYEETTENDIESLYLELQVLEKHNCEIIIALLENL